jgi:hypothetical protein
MARRSSLLLLFLTASLAVPFPAVPFALNGLGKGDAVPDMAFVGITADGGTLSSFAGEKGLIVIYWTTRSARSPAILEFAEKELRGYGKYGMNLLAVNADGREMRTEDIAAVKARTRELGVSFPVVLDAALKGYDDLGIGGVPAVVILDRNLAILEAYGGFPPTARADIRNFLDAFLGIGKKSGDGAEDRPARGAAADTGSGPGGSTE